MSTRKATVVVCDKCGFEQIGTLKDLEVLGLRIYKNFYCGPSGGGPVGDLFICLDCAEMTLHDLHILANDKMWGHDDA